MQKHILILLLLSPILLAAIFSSVLASSNEEHEELEYRYIHREHAVVDHTEYFLEENITRYEGSKTCIKCHREEVVEVFKSAHYQMAALQRDIEGYREILYGGRYTYNGFCGAIFWRDTPINWIGKVSLKIAPPGREELVGKKVSLTGCSMCHGVSMGLPPSPEPTEEQLGNIDCLACHADPSVYTAGPAGIIKNKYKFPEKVNGKLVYVVQYDRVPIDKIAKSILRVPKKESCLACHAFSGGGAHLKRPNISPDMIGNVSEEFDVHLARGLSCVDCHIVEDHRFPTLSADTWFREGDLDLAPRCESCHTSKPHEGFEGWFLNKFHGRVACQTCHIPLIAHGKYPTATIRDWSTTTFVEAKSLWKFSIPSSRGETDKWYLEGNITPIYAWYNGKRQVYVYPTPVEPLKDHELDFKPANGVSLGVVFYVKPLGDKDDTNSKIYPFKLHRSAMPFSRINKTFVPMKVGIAFATGNATLATMKGSEIAGIVWNKGDYAILVRYMQVNHGVQPAEKALSCFDCHGVTTKRLDWEVLGYGVYPKIAFTLVVSLVVLVVIGIIYFVLRKLRT